MIRRIVAFFLLLGASYGGASATTFPTCATIGATNPCITTADLVGDGTVNIRFFGAKGDGVTDDTVAIQAAIDFAYNNNLQSVFCPSGQYKISGNGNAQLYLDPPGNLRTNWNNPPLFQFSLAFIGGSHALGISNQTRQEGCQLVSSNGSNVALIIGTGQHQRVSGISVIGPNIGYRGNLSAGGIGIGVASGNGGAHHTIVENTHVENFSTCYETSVGGTGALSDSNNFLHVDCLNALNCIVLNGTQAFINRIEEPTCAATVGIKDTFSHSVLVTGGNISPTTCQAKRFQVAISNVTRPGNAIQFDGVITLPDIYIPNVYSAWSLVTPNYGVMPFTMTSWNSGTSTGHFVIDPQWRASLYGNIGPGGFNSDIETELGNTGLIYAAERIFVAWGDGIDLEGTHVENPGCPTTLFFANQVSNGLNNNIVRVPFFDYDAALPTFGPLNSAIGSDNAAFYAQKVFPFISQAQNDGSRMVLDGGTYSASLTAPSSLLIQLGIAEPFLVARALNQIGPLNVLVNGNFGEQFTTGPSPNSLETAGNGGGEWDENYFLPTNLLRVIQGSTNGIVNLFHHGGLKVPHYGYRPAPGRQPELRPDLFTALTPTPSGALGSYPPIDCQTLYRVGVAWNTLTTTTGNMFARSASCPGYSYGQNLDDSTVGTSTGTFTSTISNGGGGAGTQLNVTAIASGAPSLNAQVTGSGVSYGTYITACPGGSCGGTGIYTVNNSQNIAAEVMQSFTTTVSWHYLNDSVMVYLDATTLTWMFPGLGINLMCGGTTYWPQQLVVTGVYPDITSTPAFGYVTAMDASANAGGTLHGTGYPTIDHCTNKAGIQQQPFGWTKY